MKDKLIFIQDNLDFTSKSKNVIATTQFGCLHFRPAKMRHENIWESQSIILSSERNPIYNILCHVKYYLYSYIIIQNILFHIPVLSIRDDFNCCITSKDSLKSGDLWKWKKNIIAWFLDLDSHDLRLICQILLAENKRQFSLPNSFSQWRNSRYF